MIELDRVAVRAGAFTLEEITFRVESGQCAMLMGRSGCGKTTLLECIGGLRPVGAGRIRLCGHNVTSLGPADRQIGYVPQDLSLFQTMTIREHLEFALVVRRRPRREIGQRVAELSELLGIGPLLDRKPQGLSGGESQRVALGRALSFRPPVLLLDEPLSALDDDARESMYDLLRRVQQQTGVTTLHVTHSRREASRLADRILVLDDGRIAEASVTAAGRPSVSLDGS